MLTIRFSRVGKRNKAQFKILLQEHTIAPGGRHVEVLGSYDPHSKQAVLKEERIKYWIGKGVTTSDTAYNLLVSKGLISGKKRAVKIPVSPAGGPAKKAEEALAESPKTEASKTEEKEEKEPAEETKAEEKKEEGVKKEEAPKEEKPAEEEKKAE